MIRCLHSFDPFRWLFLHLHLPGKLPNSTANPPLMQIIQHLHKMRWEIPMQTMLIPAKLLVFQMQFWEEADLKVSPVHSEITKHHLWKRYARCCKAVMSSQKLRNHQRDLMVSPACMLTTKLLQWLPLHRADFNKKDLNQVAETFSIHIQLRSRSPLHIRTTKRPLWRMWGSQQQARKLTIHSSCCLPALRVNPQRMWTTLLLQPLPLQQGEFQTNPKKHNNFFALMHPNPASPPHIMIIDLHPWTSWGKLHLWSKPGNHMSKFASKANPPLMQIIQHLHKMRWEIPMQTMLIPAKLLVFQMQFWEEANLKVSPVHSEITKHHLWKRYARCCKAVMSSQKLRNHQRDLMVSPACMLTTKLLQWLPLHRADFSKKDLNQVAETFSIHIQLRSRSPLHIRTTKRPLWRMWGSQQQARKLTIHSSCCLPALRVNPQRMWTTLLLQPLPLQQGEFQTNPKKHNNFFALMHPNPASPPHIMIIDLHPWTSWGKLHLWSKPGNHMSKFASKANPPLMQIIQHLHKMRWEIPMQTMLIPAKLLVFQMQFWEEANLKVSPVHSEITKHHLWKRYARYCKAVMSSQKLRNHQCDLMVSPACMLTTKLHHWKAYEDGCEVVDWDRKRFMYWQNYAIFVIFPKQCGHTEGFLR